MANRTEWKEVVKPLTKRTLWDVCLFVSERTEKEVMKPIKLLGSECLNLEEKENFSPLLEETILTGVKTFDKLTYGKLKTERRFKYWFDKIIPNVIHKRSLNTGDLTTFRDLVYKIIENNKLSTTKAIGH